MRKMSASYSRNVVHDKDLLKNVVGFSSVSILRKKNIAGMPLLNISCFTRWSLFPPCGICNI